MYILKSADIRIIERAFQSAPGYVLDFSDRTFGIFFEDEIGIDINADVYSANGTSKMNRLRSFCRIEPAIVVSKALRALWTHKVLMKPAESNDESLRQVVFDLIERLEFGVTIPSTDALEKFSNDETIEEIINSINRDISANKPVAALDRLHTYCSKFFGHLLDRRGVEWSRTEPLHSRAGKYVKILAAEEKIHDMSHQIMKNSLGVLDKFNGVRNNKSLAHDNDIISQSEAKFIFESISAMLRFIKSVDPLSF